MTPQDAMKVVRDSITQQEIEAVIAAMAKRAKEGSVSAARLLLRYARPLNPATEEMLDRPVGSLDLSVRSANCLDSDGIVTIRQLIRRTGRDLLMLRNFGETSLCEIRNRLAELGLALRGEAPR